MSCADRTRGQTFDGSQRQTGSSLDLPFGRTPRRAALSPAHTLHAAVDVLIAAIDRLRPPSETALAA